MSLPARRAQLLVSRSFYPKSIISPKLLSPLIRTHTYLKPHHISNVPKGIRSFSAFQPWRNPASAAAAQAPIEQPNLDGPRSDKHAPITRFQELEERGLVSGNVVAALTNYMKLETMTPVQSQTIPAILNGLDIIAQARTGTGKTLAFLIPTVQRILNQLPELNARNPYENRRVRKDPDIRSIIISPTRELAEQIAAEARKVVSRTGIQVKTAVGGSGKAYGLARIMEDGCHILVGTPGRLADILSDPRSGVRAPKLTSFILDEADRLLDIGFAPKIREILEMLPSEREVDRQTMMFSATMAKEVMHLTRDLLKPDYQFVQTVKPGEQPTHTKVPQKIVHVAGFENLMPALLELVKRELDQSMRERPFKALVFFNANSQTRLSAELFNSIRDGRQALFGRNGRYGVDIIEMHGKLTQRERTFASNDFRRATQAIMFSSDVSARGMDFPDVTHVIQVGFPRDDDTYIHRLGRTARADKLGEGWLFVTEFEKQYIMPGRLKRMPIVQDTSLETSKIDMTKDAQMPISVAACLNEIVDANRLVHIGLKSDAYKAMLGIYGLTSRRQELVDAMNRRSKYEWGLADPPRLDAGVAFKLGYTKVDGLNLSNRDYGRGRDGDSYGDRYGDRSGDRYGDRGENRTEGYPQRDDRRDNRRSDFRRDGGGDYQPRTYRREGNSRGYDDHSRGEGFDRPNRYRN